MTRQTYQAGWVSGPISTKKGDAFKIRFRVRTAGGQWKQKTETLYGLAGKKAAKAELARRIKDASIRTTEASKLTFREFVDTYWYPYLDRRQAKPSTRKGYQCALKAHLLPVFGSMRLLDITPLDIENLVGSKLKSGLSPKTVRNLVGLLQGVFSVAVEDDLILRSPVRRKHKPTVSRKPRQAWTGEQVRAILTEIPQRTRALFWCVGLLGVRLGELLGLKWKHINFENRTLTIAQSLWKGQLVTPKTEGSIRALPFGDFLARVLTDHMQTAEHMRLEDFVFSKTDGMPYHPDVLRKDVLYPALDRLRIQRSSRMAGFHAFRHAVGSLVNDQTGNLKLAQNLLGHSNLSTTADIYTHVSTKAERSAANAVERAVFGETCSQSVPNWEQE